MKKLRNCHLVKRGPYYSKAQDILVQTKTLPDEIPFSDLGFHNKASRQIKITGGEKMHFIKQYFSPTKKLNKSVFRLKKKKRNFE